MQKNLLNLEYSHVILQEYCQINSYLFRMADDTQKKM